MNLRTTLQQVDASTINMMSRWISMWRRCYLPENPGYEYYGARGIQVCQEWLDFQAFYGFWGDPPFKGATIGRIDNDGNYEPANCEWQTQEQQNNNTRRSKLITWNGKTQSIRDWAQEYNIGTRRLSERLRRGWDMQRALTTDCPKGFAKEREERQSEYARLWELNGHLYRARSRWRRGHKLSLPIQDLLATEGVEQTRDEQLKKAKRRKRIDDETLSLIIHYHKDGASIRKISGILQIPKSTVQFHLSRIKSND
jgi:hypothetical protein